MSMMILEIFFIKSILTIFIVRGQRFTSGETGELVDTDEFINFNKLVIDVSKDCKKGYSTSVHLSFGTGSTDSRVILLRSLERSSRNCTIMVVGSENLLKGCGRTRCAIVAVIEFFNYKPKQIFCANPEAIIYIGEHNVIEDICEQYKNLTGLESEYQIHRYLIRVEKFDIVMGFTNYTGTIKLTVTAAKYMGSSGRCLPNKEIRCILGDKKLCVSRLLHCDGNYNCGYHNKFDEYCTVFPDREYMLYAVIYGLVLVGILIVFFIQILRVCIPAVAEHFFIFNEGEENKFVLATQSLRPLDIEIKAMREGQMKETEQISLV